MSVAATYAVPLKHRKIENLHIVFWLMKDISWCMLWRSLGIFMIVPTLGVAIYITWRMRKMKSEFAHNLAVVFWISANAWWMLSEFFEFDETALWHGITGRQFAMIPFLLGAAILIRFYGGELLSWRSANLGRVQ